MLTTELMQAPQSRETHGGVFAKSAHGFGALPDSHAPVKAHEVVPILRQLVLKQVQGGGELAEENGLCRFHRTVFG